MIRPPVFMLVLTLFATGAWADGYSDCNQSAELDRRIRGCTQVIERGKQESRENRSFAYANRGNAYDDKGAIDRAIADYTKAIALDPKYAMAFNNRGLTYGKKGEVDRAIADYTRAIALDPDYAIAYTNRGYAYEKKGDKNEAIADFRKSLQINPSNEDAKDSLKRLGVAP